MKKPSFLALIAAAVLFAMILTGCASTPETETTLENTTQTNESVQPATVEITDIYGTVTVPVNPKNVVALDNRTFETLSDWGIELAAVPKSIMPADSPYVNDSSVSDIGSHNDPNLEIIAAVEPELVIVGQRFASKYDEIKALVPNAVVINLNFDVSTGADHPGENLVNGLKNSTLALGKIFDKNAEAEELISDFEAAIEAAKSAYNGTDTNDTYTNESIQTYLELFDNLANSLR